MDSDTGPDREPDPEAQTLPDPQQAGGLVESGAADIPGVQDAGPADVEEEVEGAQPFSDRPTGSS
ncbi:hypothetical protein GCM10022197_27390 [Microlunatus spumicola]|uniref:Uncharacterized protein n=1 Tax=Microlunatus spumicola TaxID=81499 RepID=A0ABP6XMS1_9ACTN